MKTYYDVCLTRAITESVVVRVGVDAEVVDQREAEAQATAEAWRRYQDEDLGYKMEVDDCSGGDSYVSWTELSGNQAPDDED